MPDSHMDTLYNPNFEETSRQSFVAALKGYVNGPMEHQLASLYEKTLEPEFESKNGRAPIDYTEATPLFENTGLYQLYVIPVAVTVLVFAQLHRNDLTHQALNSIRFAASGAILAVSTIEVFAVNEPNLLRFLAVLLLSLVGTAFGIALRVRPFVFVGLAFLVLNVIGQLGLHFHREGGIVRAVILIGVGVLILAAMMFFNVHRERLLHQYRSFRSNRQWE